jgi:FkbM family methyltransferase
MQSDLVIDVGAHKGEDSEFYLKKGFRVLAIEAYPPLCEAIRLRLRQHLNEGRLTLFNVAISDTNGPVTFFANPAVSVWGTTSPDWAIRNERLGASSVRVTVEGRRFEEILEESGIPYYLKVDIEGSDLLCIRALRRFQERPKFVSIESTKTSWEGLIGELELLKELGYDRFKVVQQLDVSSQVCPFPPREGVYAPHAFEPGSTGLFGDEAPGLWLTEREARRLHRRILIRHRCFGDDGLFNRSRLGRGLMRLFHPQVGWYDTHAARAS